jgi:predicted kinase
MPTPLLIVVTGPPGSGKTTLARRLATDLALPLIARDDLKECLYDTLGWSDRAWSRRLGHASYVLLYHVAGQLLATGRPLLIESNFTPGLAEPDLLDLQQRTGCRLLILHCQATPAVLRRRIRERWEAGRRHPGHVDDQSLAEMDAQREEPDRRLALDAPSIAIDTTAPDRLDYPAILTAVRAALGTALPD